VSFFWNPEIQAKANTQHKAIGMIHLTSNQPERVGVIGFGNLAAGKEIFRFLFDFLERTT